MLDKYTDAPAAIVRFSTASNTSNDEINRDTTHGPNVWDEEIAVAADGPADSYACLHGRDPRAPSREMLQSEVLLRPRVRMVDGSGSKEHDWKNDVLAVIEYLFM